MKYPRVLIVYHSCINKADSHGVSLRNWFAEWPKESLAQIYSGAEVGLERFCGHTFRLGLEERRFGKLFFRLKDSSLGEGNRENVLGQGEDVITGKKRIAWKLKTELSFKLIESGLWELIFTPIISPRMAKWIRDFEPDVIYSQGYLLAFASLAVSLQDRFNLPGCYHAVDDWPRFLYSKSIMSLSMRPIVDRAAQKLLRSSAVRFTIGDRMANEYHSRDGLEMEPLMICDSLERFRTAQPCRLAPDDCVSIVYSGGLGHRRWESIVDLSNAARILEKEGIKIAIRVFTPSMSPEVSEVLRALTNVQCEPPPSHEDLPGVLKGADILFLPETFDPVEADVIRLSVSTKAPLYMMSETPILVYGSPLAGVVDYARKSGWGHVVEKQDVQLLAEAINMLQRDAVLRERVIQNGREVAAQNHEASAVRARFVDGMMRAAATSTKLEQNV